MDIYDVVKKLRGSIRPTRGSVKEVNKTSSNENVFPVHDFSDLVEECNNIRNSYSVDGKGHIYTKKIAELVDSGYGYFLRTVESDVENNVSSDIYEHITSILNLEGYVPGDKVELEIRIKCIKPRKPNHRWVKDG